VTIHAGSSSGLAIGPAKRYIRSNPPPVVLFNAPLLTTLQAASYAGGLTGGTPTYSRASAAYVQDHEGIQRQVLANEARFWGARRVANFYARSQDMTNVAWINPLNAIVVTAGQADPFGGTNAQRLTGDGSANAHQITQFVGGTTVGNTFTMSRYLKAFNATLMLLFLLDGSSVQGVQAQVNLVTGTFTAGPTAAGAATNVTGGIISIGNGWYRVWISCTFGAGATANPNAGISVGDGSASVYTTSQGAICYGNQLENVSGQSVVTPGEYVSTNVLSAPYQGANVDGVQYFDTTLAGVPIPATTLLGYLSEAPATNLFPNTYDLSNATWTKSNCTTSSDVGPDGVTQNIKLTTTATLAASAFNTTNFSFSATTNYTLSAYVTKSSTSAFALLSATNLATNAFGAWFNLATGAIGGNSIFGTGSVISKRVTSVGNFWRIEVTGQLSALDATMRIQLSASDADGSATSTAGKTISWWGQQAELGTAATTTIVPGTSRNGDRLLYQVAGNVSETVGTAYCETNNQQLPNTYPLSVNAASGGDILYQDGTNRAGIFDGTTGVLSVGSMVANTSYKLASAWGGATMSVTRTGATLGSGAFDGQVFTPGSTNIEVGVIGGAGPINGTVRNARFYGQKLTDAQLTAMVA